MRDIDFIIVGAQKAGTSSYASYLGEHPSVFVPAEKEAPFFADDQLYSRGYNWFQETYLSGAADKQLVCTSTPQYLLYPDSFRRIKEQLPRVKLIAILRDPISRLISHYDMEVRHGYEVRPLNQVVASQLDNIQAYRAARYQGNTIEKYIVAGEYGRSLQKAREYFPKEQILVIDFIHVIADRQSVLNDVCQFLGLQPFVPSNIERIEMQGGKSKILNIDHNRAVDRTVSFVRRHPRLNALIPKLLRSAVRRGTVWMDRVNVDSSVKTSLDDISDEQRDRLEQHYMKDKELLESLGYSMSWNYVKNSGN